MCRRPIFEIFSHTGFLLYNNFRELLSLALKHQNLLNLPFFSFLPKFTSVAVVDSPQHNLIPDPAPLRRRNRGNL